MDGFGEWDLDAFLWGEWHSDELGDMEVERPPLVEPVRYVGEHLPVAPGLFPAHRSPEDVAFEQVERRHEVSLGEAAHPIVAVEESHHERCRHVDPLAQARQGSAQAGEASPPRAKAEWYRAKRSSSSRKASSAGPVGATSRK